eukprot:m.44519 g.44519  ORF g.44519 m.44519 type:complete len:296 (-) comp10107_c0_seq1:86-973(-)
MEKNNIPDDEMFDQFINGRLPTFEIEHMQTYCKPDDEAEKIRKTRLAKKFQKRKQNLLKRVFRAPVVGVFGAGSIEIPIRFLTNNKNVTFKLKVAMILHEEIHELSPRNFQQFFEENKVNKQVVRFNQRKTMVKLIVTDEVQLVEILVLFYAEEVLIEGVFIECDLDNMSSVDAVRNFINLENFQQRFLQLVQYAEEDKDDYDTSAKNQTVLPSELEIYETDDMNCNDYKETYKTEPPLQQHPPMYSIYEVVQQDLLDSMYSTAQNKIKGVPIPLPEKSYTRPPLGPETDYMSGF